MSTVFFPIGILKTFHFEISVYLQHFTYIFAIDFCIKYHAKLADKIFTATANSLLSGNISFSWGHQNPAKRLGQHPENRRMQLQVQEPPERENYYFDFFPCLLTKIIKSNNISNISLLIQFYFCQSCMCYGKNV